MAYKILVINPGSTSTKIGLFEDEAELFRVNIEHPAAELEKFTSLYQQTDMRKAHVLDELEKRVHTVSELSCVVGRGGMLPPVDAGGYIVNKEMIDFLYSEKIPPHASNLGCIIAEAIAKPLGIPAYIYDAVSSDEFEPVARITGLKEVIRHSFCHVLNAKAAARAYAARIGKKYEELSLIVTHLGGGCTVSAHKNGRIIDSLADDNGPFAPERAGSLPLLPMIELCYSGRYTEKEMKKLVRGMGGLKSLLGTSDCRKVEEMIKNGDKEAELVYQALAFQLAKGIGNLAPVLFGKIDAVIMTGGLANSKMLTGMISERVEFIAPVVVIPGEFELEALAAGGRRILSGEESVHEFKIDSV